MLSFYWMPEIIKDIKEKSIEMLSDEQNKRDMEIEQNNS